MRLVKVRSMKMSWDFICSGLKNGVVFGNEGYMVLYPIVIREFS